MAATAPPDPPTIPAKGTLQCCHYWCSPEQGVTAGSQESGAAAVDKSRACGDCILPALELGMPFARTAASRRGCQWCGPVGTASAALPLPLL